MTSKPFVSLLVLAFLVGATAVLSSPALGAVHCDLYASTAGDDSNRGTTPETALRNIRALVPKLEAGQVGCLVGPTFTQAWDGWGAAVSGGGTTAAPVTITSAGPTPTQYSGPLVIDAGVHDVVIRDLKFVGAPSSGKDHGWTHIQINGDRVSVLNNDISDPKGICLGAGKLKTSVANDPDAVVASDLLIEGNRIHGCGKDIVNWEPDESGVHAVYMVNTQRTRIANNYIYDTINRGIQLYPHALDTLVEYNVLDGNGANVNIGSASGYYSERATFRYNIISNSQLRSVYDPPPNFSKGDTVQINGNFPLDATETQYGNSVTSNCIYQPDPTKNFGGTGYTKSPNTFADPLYVDRANKDFNLLGNSPCLAYGPRPPVEEAPTCTISGTNGNETLTGTTGDDVICGEGGNDFIRGADGNDVLLGGDGNDTLRGGAGADDMDGGAGLDVLDYNGSNQTTGATFTGVRVNLATGGASQGHATGDTFTAVESITGSAYNDELIGNAAANTLRGLAGGDTMNGSTGADTVSYSGSPDTGTATFDGVVVRLNSSASGGHADGDVMTSMERLTGSAFNDSVIGTTGPNLLNGGSGNDSLKGLAGADVLTGSTGIDTVSYTGSPRVTTGAPVMNGVTYDGVVIDLLSTTTETGGDAHGDRLTTLEKVIGSSFNDKLTGDNLDNTLSGGAGLDWLLGLDGNDILTGGTEVDTFDGGNGTDNCTDAAAEESVTSCP